MKRVINNVAILLAQKSKRERRKITLKQAAEEMRISYSTLRAVVNDTIEEYPKTMLGAMCAYFGCDVGAILNYTDIEG